MVALDVTLLHTYENISFIIYTHDYPVDLAFININTLLYWLRHYIQGYWICTLFTVP